MKNETGDLVVGSITFDGTAIRSSNVGWECPKCHRVYSPSTKTCSHCNPEKPRDNMESNKIYVGTSTPLQQLNEGN